MAAMEKRKITAPARNGKQLVSCLQWMYNQDSLQQRVTKSFIFWWIQSPLSPILLWDTFYNCLSIYAQVFQVVPHFKFPIHDHVCISVFVYHYRLGQINNAYSWLKKLSINLHCNLVQSCQFSFSSTLSFLSLSQQWYFLLIHGLFIHTNIVLSRQLKQLGNN